MPQLAGSAGLIVTARRNAWIACGASFIAT